MRSRTPLMLMEQMMMVLVFALAAALCLQAFSLSDRLSRGSADRDRAVVQAENAAEAMKHCRGDGSAAAQLTGGAWSGGILTVGYDGDWEKTNGEPAYTLSVIPEESGQEKLGEAEVRVTDADGATLWTMSVAWQEEDFHA